MNDELDNYLHDINTQLDHIREYLKVISTGVFITGAIVGIALLHFW